MNEHVHVNVKAEATAAIERAQSDLEEALARLIELPGLTSDRLTYAAHALNNYLMVVSTTGHLLEIALGKRPELEIQDRLKALKHATNLMTQLVRQLLIPEGDDRPNLLFAPTDLAKIARIACDEYDRLAADKGISIVRELPEVAVTVWSDRVAMGAVLDNLLSNAVKYSPPGSKISVRVQSSARDGIFSVTDAGPGISDSDAPRLFTRGGKLSTRPSAGEHSTGYGLAIAKDLVDALRGRIWFENEPAGGATFSFSVPLNELEPIVKK